MKTIYDSQNLNYLLKTINFLFIFLTISCAESQKQISNDLEKSGLVASTLDGYILQLGINSSQYSYCLVISKVESCNDCVAELFDSWLKDIDRKQVLVIIQTKNGKLAKYKANKLWGLSDCKVLIDKKKFDSGSNMLLEPYQFFKL